MLRLCTKKNVAIINTVQACFWTDKMYIDSSTSSDIVSL